MRFFFLASDLIPITTVLLAVALCIWATIKAKSKPAKIICVVTALVFAAGIPALYLIRYEKRWYSYTLDHNIMIRNGKHDQCPKEKTQKWVDWVITYWSKYFDRECVIRGLENDLILCKDQTAFTFGPIDKLFTGFTYGDLSYIGYSGKDKDLTEHVFKHELSHNVLFICHKYNCKDPEAHHIYFKEVGFPY